MRPEDTAETAATHSYTRESWCSAKLCLPARGHFRVKAVRVPLHIFVLSYHCIPDVASVTQIQQDPLGAPQ